MKLALPGIPLFALLAFINSGCATEKPQAQGSVLDVGPQPSAALPSTPPPPAAYSSVPYTGPTYSAPKYAPPTATGRAAARPANAPPPDAAVPVAVAPPTAPVRTYMVQKGDTLFGIARAHYGDGNKWKKIAIANPSMNPDALRLGQKIVIPQE